MNYLNISLLSLLYLLIKVLNFFQKNKEQLLRKQNYGPSDYERSMSPMNDGWFTRFMKLADALYKNDVDHNGKKLVKKRRNLNRIECLRSTRYCTRAQCSNYKGSYTITVRILHSILNGPRNEIISEIKSSAPFPYVFEPEIH